jgi:hypothetical protein
MSTFKRDEHAPKPPQVEKVTEMNVHSEKCKDVLRQLEPFERAADPDNDFNEVHGVYRYQDKSTFEG